MNNPSHTLAEKPGKKNIPGRPKSGREFFYCGMYLRIWFPTARALMRSVVLLSVY